MKKYLFGAALLAVIFSGCAKLKEDAFSSITTTSFYTSASDLNAGLIADYKDFQTFINRYQYFMQIECASETGAPTATKENGALYNSWAYANNPDNSILQWAPAYVVINQANVILARGETITMDATAKNQIYGQARFLRALSYFYLLRLYGGVPIPQTFTTSLSGLEIPRKTVDEVYDYIIADLTFSAANLPKKSAYAAADKFRASQGSAWALLGKVYLYRASMATDASKATTYYQQSKTFSGQVITSGEYQLQANFKDLWYWWNTACKEGIESVFEVEFGNNSSAGGNLLHQYGGLNLTDPNLGSYQFTRWGASNYAYDLFTDNDSRKAATFLTSITLSTGSTITWYESNKGKFTVSPGNWPIPTPGNMKYYDRTLASYQSNGYPASDIYIIRYADVLLNYAEAENALNGASGDAYSKLNAVRTRATLPNLTAGLATQAFSDSLYRERTFEFVGEGQLYYDALRTDRLGALVQKEVGDGVAKGINMYTTLAFKPKKTFLWKIPTSDLNSNPALVQNPDNVGQ